MKIMLAIATALLLGATAANAAPIEIDGSYSIAYQGIIGNAPTFTSDLTKSGTPTSATSNVAFSELLNVGVATSTTKFFAVSPAGSCGSCSKSKNGKTATGTISVTFKFTSPILSSSTLSDSAAYIANYANDTDSVTWNSPSTLVVNFTSGAILDIALINASDWTIYPKISFNLVQGPTVTPPPVPEPATYLLFGAGLFGLGFFMMRNRRRATSSPA